MSNQEIISIAIVGRPNVGKSTLFNRLIRQKKAIETPIAGTTRDRLYGDFSWRGKKYQLIDTAGLLYHSRDEIEIEAYKSTQIAIEQADIIVFVADFSQGVTDLDLEIAKLLKKRKNVVLAVNKCDSNFDDSKIVPFKRLGIGKIVLISAISGKNTGDFLEIVDEIASALPERKKTVPEKNKAINLSIIGRPNAGKSTLINTIMGEEKMIVSSQPGTTRDAQEFYFNHKGSCINLVDTAGIRRKSKVRIGSIEGYALLRSFRAIREADTVIYLMDASQGIVSIDQNLLGEAEKNGKSIILAINKIDLWGEKTEENMSRFIAKLQQELNFMPWLPVIFISAKDKTNVEKLLDQVVKIENESPKSIPQADLDNLLLEAKEYNNQIKYISQLTYVCSKPVVFKIKTKKNKKPHFSHLRYLENRIRDIYLFRGRPIFIDWLH